MAFLSNTVHVPFAHRFSAVIATLITDFTNYRMYRKTIAELQKLSDRELTDLGLSRSEVKYSATKAVYGN
jgi:uncharacterized protein YjiS (DUF1127 family)